MIFLHFLPATGRPSRTSDRLMCRVSIETPSLWDEQESSTYADYENHVPLGRTEFSYIFSRLQPVPLGRATAPCIRSASKPRPSRTSQIFLHFLPATGRPSRTSDSLMCRVSIETPSLWDEQESSTYADYENHVPLGRDRFCYTFSRLQPVPLGRATSLCIGSASKQRPSRTSQIFLQFLRLQDVPLGRATALTKRRYRNAVPLGQ